jgi:acyl-CoA synthetase (AMP-forming)/AMP-acid ligase II
MQNYLTVQSLLFEKIALYRNKVAIEKLGKKIYYSELDILSTYLAWQIMNHGIEKGMPVGILSSDDEDLIFTILTFLSIIKISCIFLHIDSKLDEKSINEILREKNVNLIILNKSSSRKFDTVKEITIDDSYFYIKSQNYSLPFINHNLNDILYEIDNPENGKISLTNKDILDCMLNYKIDVKYNKPLNFLNKLCNPPADSCIDNIFREVMTNEIYKIENES